ncbi:hypothetical protein [Methanocaldococcus sp.]
MAKKKAKTLNGRTKVVGRKYIYFYNKKTGIWYKAKRLKDGKIKIVGKATMSEVKRASR